jgi:FkbM family methyltransferase
MLKAIRKNPFFNQIIRKFLSALANQSQTLTHRWRLSGVVDLQFDKLHFKYYTACDDGIAEAIYYQHNYVETSELRLFKEFARRSRNIIDIGANTGIYSLISALTQPRATIYAFEPYSVNLARLQKNLALNQTKNIEVIAQAVGNLNTKIKFSVPAHGKICDTSSANADFSQSTYQGEVKWQEVEVEQIMLDSFAEQKKLPIDLLKIDVEGYEMSVFEGATSFFSLHRPNIFCEIFLNEENKAYFENFLNKYNYTAYLMIEEGLVRLDKSLIKNQDGLNYLFSPQKSQEVYLSFKNIAKIVEELSNPL